jgi:hypothetical protein
MMGRKTLLLTLVLCATPAFSTTLREALVENGIEPQGLDASRLDRKIASYSSLHDAGVFVIAYFPDGGSGRVGEALSVDLRDKTQNAWRSREFRREGGEGVSGPNFGHSVTGVWRRQEFLYLDTHVNPSASYTLVLTTKLDYLTTVHGWPLAIWPDGLLIYQNSEVHFAPTHYTEISVFDPRQKRTWLIYPRKPYQPLRAQHVEKVRAAYQKRGEEWFRQNNHHGNPELFDNYLSGQVAANPSSRAVAFRIAYDNTDTWELAEKLKLQRFGLLARGLEGVPIAPRPAASAFDALAEWLNYVRRGNLQKEFLDLFRSQPALQEMLRKGLEIPERSEESWLRRFSSLDSRWESHEVWAKMREVLATPPETTEVIGILRNVDRQPDIECREILASDYEQRFGDLPLEELLTPARLKEVFGN